MLLSAADVQADLGLTPQQIKKIDALAEGFRADAGRAMAAPGTDASPEAAVKSLDDEVAAYNRELATVLTAAQRQRVREIQIQMVGNVALLEPPIQKQLGLPAEVTAKLDAAAQENVAKVLDLRKELAAGKISADDFRTRVGALGRELDRRLGEMVSPETRAALAELGGAPFAGAPR
jgi:hypothetical protein